MTTSDKDARSYQAIKVGDQPLVPPEVQKRGIALEIALAAIDRLNSLKRPRSQVLHHRRAPSRACSQTYDPEAEA
jgi:hypothetical protein